MALSSLLCSSWTLESVRLLVSPDPVFWSEANVARRTGKYLTLCGPMELQDPVTDSSPERTSLLQCFPSTPAWVQTSPGTRQSRCYTPSPAPSVKSGEFRSMSSWRGWWEAQCCGAAGSPRSLVAWKQWEISLSFFFLFPALNCQKTVHCNWTGMCSETLAQVAQEKL